MTSTEWQQRIVDLESEIAAKTARLSMLMHAKAAAILEPKKLQTLEAEEAAIPALIESLKRRLPLLAAERETALKAEAGERLRELAQQRVAAAAKVTQSSREIREFMAALLGSISEAHASWQGEAQLAAEAAYLSLRFGLPAPQIAHGTRLTPEEQHAFIREFELKLRQPVDTKPWDRLRGDFQAEQRRQEAQRRVEEDARHPPSPNFIHFADLVGRSH